MFHKAESLIPTISPVVGVDGAVISGAALGAGLADHSFGNDVVDFAQGSLVGLAGAVCAVDFGHGILIFKLKVSECGPVAVLLRVGFKAVGQADKQVEAGHGLNFVHADGVVRVRLGVGI